MSKLFTNHRLNICETVQVKLADLRKPIKTLQVQVKLLNACKPPRMDKVNKPYKNKVYKAFIQYDFAVWRLFINFES